MTNFLEWWEVETTGWFGGISWFPRTTRYDSVESAISKIDSAKKYDGDASTKYRYVHVTVQREPNKEVITRECYVYE
jgi:hypothetical protein